jgi:hypothetical protein
MRIDLMLTSPTTYKIVMDPLGSAATYTHTGTIKGGSGQIDWLEFTFFNTPTDTGSPPTTATDFYISSMKISPIPEPATAVLMTAAGLGALALARRTRDETA